MLHPNDTILISRLEGEKRRGVRKEKIVAWDELSEDEMLLVGAIELESRIFN